MLRVNLGTCRWPCWNLVSCIMYRRTVKNRVFIRHSLPTLPTARNVHCVLLHIRDIALNRANCRDSQAQMLSFLRYGMDNADWPNIVLGELAVHYIIWKLFVQMFFAYVVDSYVHSSEWKNRIITLPRLMLYVISDKFNENIIGCILLAVVEISVIVVRFIHLFQFFCSQTILYCYKL